MKKEIEEQEFIQGWCKFCKEKHMFVTKANSPDEVVGCKCPYSTTREEIKKFPEDVRNMKTEDFWNLQIRRNKGRW